MKSTKTSKNLNLTVAFVFGCVSVVVAGSDCLSPLFWCVMCMPISIITPLLLADTAATLMDIVAC